MWYKIKELPEVDAVSFPSRILFLMIKKKKSLIPQFPLACPSTELYQNQALHTARAALLTPTEADSLLLLSSRSLSTRGSTSVTLSVPLSREGALCESLHIF